MSGGHSMTLDTATTASMEALAFGAKKDCSAGSAIALSRFAHRAGPLSALEQRLRRTRQHHRYCELVEPLTFRRALGARRAPIDGVSLASLWSYAVRLALPPRLRL
jgi:hypothetical protein